MFKEPLDEQSFYSPLRMFGGGRRESRNAIPIEVKVAAISKIQSGRGLMSSLLIFHPSWQMDRTHKVEVYGKRIKRKFM